MSRVVGATLGEYACCMTVRELRGHHRKEITGQRRSWQGPQTRARLRASWVGLRRVRGNLNGTRLMPPSSSTVANLHLIAASVPLLFL